jgi:signal transduction histidine kinase
MRKRTFLWLVAGVVALAAINLAFLIAAPGQRPQVALDDISEALTPLAAAAACLFTAAHGRGRARQSWALIGISAACWGLGQSAWTYQEVFLNLHPADLFPSLADLGYLSAVPFALVGLMRLPGGATTAGGRLRSLLDGLLIAAGLLFISWDLVLGPVYTASPTELFSKAVGLAYPVSDIAMVTIVLLTISRVRVGQRAPLALLAGGMLLNAAADSSFAYLTTVQNFSSSYSIDLGWTMGYALIGLAAIRAGASRAAADAPASRLPRWKLLMPYAAVAVAGVLAVITEITAGSLSRVLVWDLLVAIGVVLIRQFLFLRETHTLNGQIASKNDELDQRVRERTRALTESLEELHQTGEERRQLLLRLVTLQEEERRRIALIIHDDMLQSMIGAKMRMFLLADASGANATAAATIESAIDRAIVRMRSLMTDLRPQILDMGLNATLEQSIAEFNDAGLAVTLENHLQSDPSVIVGTTLYRIVCEAVTNAHKHAPGATVTVTLNGGGGDGFRARVSDDGPGFTPQANGSSPQGHVGLSAMRERAEALGGSARLDTALGQGTTVEIWLPPQVAVAAEVPAA